MGKTVSEIEIPCSWCQKMVKLPSKIENPNQVLCSECYERMTKLKRFHQRKINYAKQVRGYYFLR